MFNFDYFLSGLSYLFNDIGNNFNESQCGHRRRSKSYVMATSSGLPLSGSGDSVVIQNASSPDVKLVSFFKLRFDDGNKENE
ncbi:unnamed protein product [Cercopithifilaria johnstoni]|uniref:Uncharacterized protein n=1 Tax=Cercopithifilaria johnstoni TaxID=2874296 RepID=A0A8J2PX72_9BILA|nr:unnamed protein product [Cercopithifilaria johnstoni]